VGGLLFGQIVTLYLTPVFYSYMGALLKWFQPDAQTATQESAGEAVLAHAGEQHSGD
jgi:hypothetical protein